MTGMRLLHLNDADEQTDFEAVNINTVDRGQPALQHLRDMRLSPQLLHI